MNKKVGVIVVVVLIVLVIYFGWVNPLAVSNRKKCSLEICDGLDNDCDKLIDENLAIACRLNSDCGVNGWTGVSFCGTDGNVHRNWTNHTCNIPGKCKSRCSSVDYDRSYRACSNGCLNGECKKPNSCNDTDNGQVPGVKGTVSGYYNSTLYNMTDYCNLNSSVVEYYCSVGRAYNVNLNCTNKTVCSDGACK